MSDPYVPEANENRPPRINQFSFGVQQEVTKDLIVKAYYVGNRAVWLGSGPLGSLDGTGVNSSGSAQISAQQYAAFGFYPYPETGPAGSYERARARFAIHPLTGVCVLLPLPGFIGAFTGRKLGAITAAVRRHRLQPIYLLPILRAHQAGRSLCELWESLKWRRRTTITFIALFRTCLE